MFWLFASHTCSGLSTCYSFWWLRPTYAFGGVSYIPRHHSMIPLFPINKVCPIYYKTSLDIFREHTIHCRDLPCLKSWHDLVRDILFDIFRWVGAYVKKVALMIFLTDPCKGWTTLRSLDVLVYGWVWNKHAFVELIRVYLLVEMRIIGFTMGNVALKVLQVK